MTALDATVIVGTFGADEWKIRALAAIASAEDQAPTVHVHAATLARARNLGAEQATTEWLCFLDADDELAPGFFEPMAAAAADLRCPAVQYVRRGRVHPPKLWPPVDLRDGNYLVVGTLVRRDLFLQVGGFDEEPIYEDWSLWQRCWKAGATIEQVPDAVYVAHVRPGSRNRGPSQAYRTEWHHRIRRANFPELYDTEDLAA